MSNVIENLNKEFAQDVVQGLTDNPKHISSKYFYDDKGSQIFQEIMQMEEYYPTRCEFEILAQQSHLILEALSFKGNFRIVELGAGDGYKTSKLLETFLEHGAQFTYCPIDISQEAILSLEKNLFESLPSLKIESCVGDYHVCLEQLHENTLPTLFLFLGGNIGNYSKDQSVELLNSFGKWMRKDDKMLIGMDLQKNPRIIRMAYDDPSGITKRFNLNLLERMNRELGANFRMDQFDFYCSYNPENGALKSYIYPTQNVIVHFDVLEKSFEIKANELIYTELSHKFSNEQINDLAKKTNFERICNFYDCRNYFTDTLWSFKGQ